MTNQEREALEDAGGNTELAATLLSIRRIINGEYDYSEGEDIDEDEDVEDTLGFVAILAEWRAKEALEQLRQAINIMSSPNVVRLDSYRKGGRP